MINKYLLILIVLFAIGCREEIILDSISNKESVVVDGLITNEPGPYRVMLSLTSSVREPKNIPYSGCTVTIYEDSGDAEVLNETEPGVYYTSPTGLRGKIGYSYRITIITPNGQEYASEYQEIKVPVGIDSIFVDTMVIGAQGFPDGLPGYQFYTSTELAPEEDNFFLWRITETYKYNADYRLHALYKYGKILVNNIDTITGFDSLQTCYKTEEIKNIYVGKTSNLSVPKISKQHLHFVGTDSKKLLQKYSLLLKQLTINEETYEFWSKIYEQTSQDNILLAKQPYNIIGNIRSVDNSKQTLLGYFTVASVKEKRVFFGRPYHFFYYETCDVGTDLKNMSRLPGPFYLVLSDEGLGKVHPDCLDCRTSGGVIRKPDFWND